VSAEEAALLASLPPEDARTALIGDDIPAEKKADFMIACAQALIELGDRDRRLKDAMMPPPWAMAVLPRPSPTRVRCAVSGGGNMGSGYLDVDVRCNDPNDKSCSDPVELVLASEKVYPR